MLHCATVEIPHCVGSCAANPIGLLSVFGTLRNYCLVPLLAYAFTRERLIHNSGLTGGIPKRVQNFLSLFPKCPFMQFLCF